MKKLSYEHAIRFRPKHYSKPVWSFLVTQAIFNKEWALKTIKTNPQWTNEASEMSIQALGKYLHMSIIDLANDSYKYFHLRAHGEESGYILDRSARNKWEMLTGKKINKSKINSDLYKQVA